MRTFEHPHRFCRCNNGDVPWHEVTDGRPIFTIDGVKYDSGCGISNHPERIIMHMAWNEFKNETYERCSKCEWIYYHIEENPYYDESPS